MKKIFSFILAALCALIMFAQTNPNRVVITKTSGRTQSILAERIQDITFQKVEGVAKVDLTVSNVTTTSMKLTTVMSDACAEYTVDVMPYAQAKGLGDNLAEYLDMKGGTRYSQNFTAGDLTGIELADQADYAVVALAYDNLGTPCTATLAKFTTPARPLIGDPQVTATFSGITQYSFTGNFVPNDDVTGYATVAGKKGEIQSQYDQYAGWMGFKNFGDLVKAWGDPRTDISSFTWKDMEPGTTYEVFVQAWDDNNTYAELQTYEVTTLTKGTDKEASVAITLGEHKLTDWGGEQKYSQFITFTPDENARCYRYCVYLAEEYDADAEGNNEYVMSEPPMPNMSGWFFYEPLTTDFQIDPGVEAVAVAAAQNANGEWGKPTVLRFTTPAAAGVRAKKSASVLKRDVKQFPFSVKECKVPALKGGKIFINGK